MSLLRAFVDVFFIDVVDVIVVIVVVGVGVVTVTVVVVIAVVVVAGVGIVSALVTAFFCPNLDPIEAITMKQMTLRTASILPNRVKSSCVCLSVRACE